MTKKENFIQKLAFGEEGEKQVLEYLINNEHRICLPMYQFNPKQAPIWIASTGNIIAPDIVSMINTKTVFVECKRKNFWVTKYNKDTERETGIDTRLWIHYMSMVRLSNVKLEIYFLQEKNGPEGLYRISITKELLDEFWENPNIFRISPMTDKTGKMYRMIFFPFERLQKLL